jgi:hypothetical protein
MPCRQITAEEFNDPNRIIGEGYTTIEECQGNCTEFYVVCSVRTEPGQRIAAGSNYEVLINPPTLPIVIRPTQLAWYWAVSIMAGPYSTKPEADAWIAENGNGGLGSIECYPGGTAF